MFSALVTVALAAASVLGTQFAAIAVESRGKVGMSAAILETGQHLSFHGRDRFPMQSVYKLPIAMTVLREVDAGRLRLERPVRISEEEMAPPTLHSPIRDRYPNGVTLTVREILGYAVADSDGTASDVLLRQVGGPPAVMRYLDELGIHGLRVENTELELSRERRAQYRNWAQPDEAVELLRAFEQGRGLKPESRRLLRGWMVQTTTGLNRLRAGLPPETEVAHKTGTSDTLHGVTAATNDIGIITLPDGRHMAIAVFVCDSPGGVELREGTIAKMARAAWEWARTQK